MALIAIRLLVNPLTRFHSCQQNYYSTFVWSTYLLFDSWFDYFLWSLCDLIPLAYCLRILPFCEAWFDFHEHILSLHFGCRCLFYCNLLDWIIPLLIGHSNEHKAPLKALLLLPTFHFQFVQSWLFFGICMCPVALKEWIEPPF